MIETNNGLSIEFISHPGDTLAELMEQYGVSQKELSLKTQTSEKHINEIVNGKKGITVSFAKKLENVFKPEASFWINRQNLYDEELENIKIIENISDEEKEIGKQFPISELIEYGYIKENRSEIEDVLALRKFSGTSNLLNVLDVLEYLISTASFKTIPLNAPFNPYIIYAWLRMCQFETESIYNPNPYDINLLKSSLKELKELSFLENFDKAKQKVSELLYKCGINFKVVNGFKDLNVQGYIKTVNNNISMCIPLDCISEDVFWFTLFHEIGHLVHKRNNRAFIDFLDNYEQDADSFANDYLIRPASYKKLLSDISKRNIIICAKENNICPGIVVGRLRKEKEINANQYSELIRNRK